MPAVDRKLFASASGQLAGGGGGGGPPGPSPAMMHPRLTSVAIWMPCDAAPYGGYKLHARHRALFTSVCRLALSVGCPTNSAASAINTLNCIPAGRPQS